MRTPIADGDWRNGNVPNDLTIEFCDERNGKGVGCAQFTNDELLGMVSMRRVLKSADGDLLDGLDVVGTFCANMHRHVELEMA